MQIYEHDWVFQGAQDPPDVGSRDSGPFCQATVKTGGTPHVKVVNGFMDLYLDATLENQLACLYQGDQLGLQIDRLKQVEVWCKLLSATVPPSVSFALGVASARANDPDSIACHALFRGIGSGAIVCETDDGTNDNDDVVSGFTLGTTLSHFKINFAQGVATASPPGTCRGGKGDVLFSAGLAADAGPTGRAIPVCRNTQFDMSNYSSGLQVFAQIQKGAASSVVAADVTATLRIERIKVRLQTGQ